MASLGAVAAGVAVTPGTAVGGLFRRRSCGPAPVVAQGHCVAQRPPRIIHPDQHQYLPLTANDYVTIDVPKHRMNHPNPLLMTGDWFLVNGATVAWVKCYVIHTDGNTKIPVAGAGPFRFTTKRWSQSFGAITPTNHTGTAWSEAWAELYEDNAGMLGAFVTSTYNLFKVAPPDNTFYRTRIICPC